MKALLLVLMLIMMMTSAYGWQSNEQWQEITSPEANCSVLLPGKAVKKDLSFDAFGSKVNAHLIVSQFDQNTYTLICMEIPDAILQLYTPDKMLDLESEDFTKAPKIDALTIEKFDFDSYPGRKLTYTLNDRLFQRRTYFIDHNVYILTTEANKFNFESAQSNKFFASFKLLAKPSFTTAEITWQDFSSVLGNFVVTLPGIPDRNVEQIPTRFGQHSITTYLLIGHDANLYFITYQDFTDEELKQLSTQEIINDSRDLMINNTKGKVLQETFTKFNNYPAKFITLEADKIPPASYPVKIDARFILINNRLYQLVIIANKSSNSAENIEKFFNSFKLYDTENYSDNKNDNKNDNKSDDRVVTPTTQGIKNPTILSKIKPKYTNDARRNKIEGVVVISAVFRKNGKITDFKVVKGLGYGLDEEAIEAAGKIKFTPGQLDGRPVNIRARLEYTFTLLDDPDKLPAEQKQEPQKQ